MGSLMSGWSSTVLPDKKVRLMRNRSLTKEEVEALWRQRGRPLVNGEAAGSPLASPRVGDVVSASASLPSSPRDREEIQLAARAKRLDQGKRSPACSRRVRTDLYCASYGGGQHSSPRSEPSSPATTRVEGRLFPETGADSPSTSRDWWTRSSWAFLNEPRQEVVVLGRARTYTCTDPIHVARIVTGNA